MRLPPDNNKITISCLACKVALTVALNGHLLSNFHSAYSRCCHAVHDGIPGPTVHIPSKYCVRCLSNHFSKVCTFELNMTDDHIRDVSSSILLFLFFHSVLLLKNERMNQ